MPNMRTGRVAALDIGSSKICCAIADVGENGDIRVLGAMHRESDGVENGVVVDMNAAREAILSVVAAAENYVGERIERVFINLSGGEFHSEIQEIEMAIDGLEISDTDIRRADLRNSQIVQPANDVLVHSLPIKYSIDGNRGIRDPRGMFGERLGISYLRVAVSAGPVQSIHNCVEGCHLKIEGTVATPYASGLSCLSEDERNLGVTLVDMGGGTTTVAVFYEGQVVFLDSIPIGGHHITSDIARGLLTSVTHAERLKTLYGDVLPPSGSNDAVIDVPVLGDDNTQSSHIPMSVLSSIMIPRVEETLEQVRETLKLSHTDQIAGRGLVLTGGAAQLRGLVSFAEAVLEKKVRIGRPSRFHGLAEANSGPAFATCTGLLRYAVEKSAEGLEAALGGINTREQPLPVRAMQWIKECF